MKMTRLLTLGSMVAVVLALQIGMSAQDDYRGQDPPSRVARLNHADGSVSFQPGGEGDWVQAVPNRPLTTGDNLWADQSSRAELHVGSTALRIGSETSLTFLDLDDQTTQLKLSQGSLIVRVRHLDDGDSFEIDTPNLAFIVQQPGEYRLDVNGDGSETDATVWHGRGEVMGGGTSYVVVAGQYARFAGTDELDHQIQQVRGSDDFDSWAFSRDRHEDHSESANYISTEMTGYEDLDDYGSWHYVAEYGPVWSPRGIDRDWAPYRHGHWAWVEPWGWTWVEEEPWGFAPFHYGRWAYVSDSWCWVPGPVVVRPVYAPALVAFVGGGGFSVSVGFGGGGGVGWFPLAPREVYVPWYRTSPRYVNNVNITNTRVNVTQVTNVYNTYNNTTINNSNSVTRVNYVNQHVNNATTVVSHDTFVNARPVRTNLVRVDARQIEQAQVVRAAPVQPVRTSVLGAGAPARFRPPISVANRQVVASRTPTAPQPSFDQRQVPNVRTENPGRPQPVGRMGNEPIRGLQNQGRMQGNETPQPMRGNMAPRPGNEIQRPQEPISNVQQQNESRPQSNVRPDLQRNNRGAQPERQIDTSRGQPQPNQNPQSAMDERNVPRPQQSMQIQRPEGGNPRPNDQQSSRPMVRQIPPPQERPEQQRNEERKFNDWQQQHQAIAPREVPRAAEQPRVQPPQERPQPQQQPQRPQSQQQSQPQQQQPRGQPQEQHPRPDAQKRDQR